MQGQRDSKPHARLNTFHGTKKQLLGHHVQPAWKPNAVAASNKQNKQSEASGCKILLSRLPADVGEKEVEELFRKTVGTVKDCFMIYNSQAKSKGMAVVTFAKASDASSAKAKYHGKIVDGRRPLKIEFITEDLTSSVSPPQPRPLTLLQRLGDPVANPPIPSIAATPSAKPASKRNPPGKPAPIPQAPAAPPVRRQRIKKGPRRLHKREPVTAAQLDQDMDAYRTTALGMDTA